jgi:hypothetical protein
VVQTRDNVEQLRFVSPPVRMLARGDPATIPAMTASPTSDDATLVRGSIHPGASLIRGHSASTAASAATSVAAAGSLDRIISGAQGLPTVDEAGTQSMSAEPGSPLAAAEAAVAATAGTPPPKTWLSQEYYSSPPGDMCDIPFHSMNSHGNLVVESVQQSHMLCLTDTEQQHILPQVVIS